MEGDQVPNLISKYLIGDQVCKAQLLGKRKHMFFAFKTEISRGERREICSIPAMRSEPMMMESPDPGTQQSEFVIQLTALVMFFQREEVDPVKGTVVLSQVSTEV
jgi:hypothetical protein